MRPLSPSLLHSPTSTSPTKTTSEIKHASTTTTKTKATTGHHQYEVDHRDHPQHTPPKQLSPSSSVRGKQEQERGDGHASTTTAITNKLESTTSATPTSPMEGIISISTAAATPNTTPTPAVNGRHHNHNNHDDEKKKYAVVDDRRRQSSPTLGKNGQQHNKKALFSETVNNSYIKNGDKHSSQDIRIHSPYPSSSPSKTKNTNGSSISTRFNVNHNEHDESEDQRDDHEHDQDDHESHFSGMDLDSHDHRHGHYDDDRHHFSDDKYKSLKRKLKLALEDNERMSHELDKFYRRVRHLRREKNLLLDRLCTLQRQGSDSGSDSISSLSSDNESSDSSLSDESRRPAQRADGSKQGPGGGKGSGNKGGRRSGGSQTASNTSHSAATTLTGEVASSSTQHPKKKGGVRRSSPSAADAPTPTSARSGPKEFKAHTPAAVPSTITNVGSATQKPKRVHQTNKQRPGLAKARKVQIVEKDDQGNVKLPVTVGIITILNIGHVVYDREAFHNDRYIWPVGYKMSRSYNSMIDPTTHTTYTCSVIDDGEAPKFQIDAEDQPGKPIIAGTATGAWTHIVKTANAIRKRDHSNSASGPDYFGFSNATIAKMIQDLPNAEKCSTYVMQQFEEIAGSGGSALTGAAGGTGSGAAGQTLGGGGGVTGKRKVSTLASGAKAGKDQNDDDHDVADGETGATGGNDDEDDDEEYTSLGSLSKPTNLKSTNVALNSKQKKTKKTKLSTATPVAVPAIRLAGINDFAPVSSNPPPLSTTGSLSVKEEINDGQDGGEETVSESGSPRSSKQQRQSNGTSTAEVAAATDLADQDVDVDVVDVDDDDEEMRERPRRTLSPVGANGSEAQHDDEGVTTDEDVPLHKA
ncbi:hypothetical protein BG015_008733 [Linnemannia schmuckeri]|uniref:FYR N-terminal domain-containing protein n=1 Tax=Linnemannia schmuckeri TaxID=64567 RepID=A0A9P5V9X0_9FUNG|nr:hypothetical protein BG015_008733 [Linnemannia schmuckeri]